jgi:flagellar biogenesis protein FliO
VVNNSLIKNRVCPDPTFVLPFYLSNGIAQVEVIKKKVWWMNSLFGIALAQPYIYVLALAGILALLALFSYLLRRLVHSSRGFDGSGRGRLPRLGVVDTFSVDRQRQLMIVRRDTVEHLILIGGNSDLVIETNITRSNVIPQRDAANAVRLAPTVSTAPTMTAEIASEITTSPNMPNAPFSVAAKQTVRPRNDETNIQPTDFAEIARQFERRTEQREHDVTRPEVSVYQLPKVSGLDVHPESQKPLTATHELISQERADQYQDQNLERPEPDPLSAPIIPMRAEMTPTEGLRRLLGRDSEQS